VLLFGPCFIYTQGGTIGLELHHDMDIWNQSSFWVTVYASLVTFQTLQSHDYTNVQGLFPIHSSLTISKHVVWFLLIHQLTSTSYKLV